VTADITSPAQLSQFSGSIQTEQPNNRLYNFDGTLSTNSPEGFPKDYPLDPGMLLLRGALLKNTTWIYGIVIFTGHESKLMLNSR
jgi:phospholipid-transporting ATPase